jgi:hypothetical protein
MKFSAHFNLKKTQSELDFVDIDLTVDTHLYIDPYALTESKDQWSDQCSVLITSYFEELLAAITSKNFERGKSLLSRLGEPEETRLGVSSEGNVGRGIGEVQAAAIFDSLLKSSAAKSGLLEDLSDLALFIPGVGRDKISDMTTNIVRTALIEYTNRQCVLHGIPVQRPASGWCWSPENRKWQQSYVELPVVENRKILLVPKFSVRYVLGVDAEEYKRKYVLEFLQAEHLRADDSLVKTLKNKQGHVTKKVYKKTLEEHYKFDKDKLAVVTSGHIQLLASYKASLRKAGLQLDDLAPDTQLNANTASQLCSLLDDIPAGNADADRYHNLIIGAITFVFYPSLIYPQKETQINAGRKRIDITYVNGKIDGTFFYRVALDPHLRSNIIHVECKNYSSDIANAEFDQLGGRFDVQRGRFGMLFYRSAENKEAVLKRAQDVSKQGTGLILPVDDLFLKRLIQLRADAKCAQIDLELTNLYQTILS